MNSRLQRTYRLKREYISSELVNRENLYYNQTEVAHDEPACSIWLIPKPMFRSAMAGR